MCRTDAYDKIDRDPGHNRYASDSDHSDDDGRERIRDDTCGYANSKISP